MILKSFLKILMECSWLITLFCTARFLYSFYKKENRINVFVLLLVAAVMLYGNFTSSIRGGYDNNHDFTSVEIDSHNNNVLFSYKEISPVFLKDIIDRASNYSLKAILDTNRIIPLFSMLLFFAMARYAGAGSIGSLAGTAVLFLNFHTFLNASAFSTTSAAVFIFISSLAAFVSFLRKNNNGYGDLVWFSASSILSIMCRVEQTPVLFMLAAYLIINRIKNPKEINLKNPLILISAAGLSLMTLCFCFQLSYPSIRLFHRKSPLTNFNMQIIQENIALIFSGNPAGNFPSENSAFSVECLVVLLFLATGLYCLKIIRINWKHFFNDLHFLFFLILFYNAIIYRWQDIYPLHFIRHRLFMFIPFSALCCFSVKSILDAAEKKGYGNLKPLCIVTITAFVSVYTVLNLVTSYSLKNNLRSNDIEWAFLVKSQNEIKGRYIVNSGISLQRRDLMRKYFSAGPETQITEKLFYIPPEALAFSKEKKEWKTENMIPFKTISYPYRFHTIMKYETHDTVTVKPGFYRIADIPSYEKRKINAGITYMSVGNFNAAEKIAEQLCSGKCSNSAHFYRFIAFSATHNDSEAEKDYSYLANTLNWQYSDDRLNTLKEQIQKNGGQFLSFAAAQTVGKDPEQQLDILFDSLSFELTGEIPL